MAKPNLEDYITVAERIEAFYKDHPDGSLRAEILSDDGKRVVMRAAAYRTPTDDHPGIGHAEEVRGEGMVNKTSALENCETSAWGRAIAALGFHVSKGVASREEVEQAQAEEKRQAAESKNGKPQLVEQAWVENARARIAAHGEGMSEEAQKAFGNEVRMKLTALNAGNLSELTPLDASKFDAWLSAQTKAAVNG